MAIIEEPPAGLSSNDLSADLSGSRPRFSQSPRRWRSSRRARAERADRDPQSGADRGAVAIGPADLRSLGARAARSGPAGRHPPRPSRQGRQAPHGRRRRAGHSAARALARSPASAWAWRPGAGVLHARGRARRPSYVRHLRPRLARKAGIDRRVHAHGLRHTYAAELARDRTPINIMRDALGHSTLQVTDRYLRDVAPMHVIDTIRGGNWEGV